MAADFRRNTMNTASSKHEALVQSTFQIFQAWCVETAQWLAAHSEAAIDERVGVVVAGLQEEQREAIVRSCRYAGRMHVALPAVTIQIYKLGLLDDEAQPTELGEAVAEFVIAPHEKAQEIFDLIKFRYFSIAKHGEQHVLIGPLGTAVSSIEPPVVAEVERLQAAEREGETQHV